LKISAFPSICRLNGGVYGGSTDLALAAISALVSTPARCYAGGAARAAYYKSGIKRYVSRLGADNARKLFF